MSSTTDLRAFIAQLPKAELHVHLEGTLEPELSFALAARNGVALGHDTPEALIAAYDFHDLPSFLAIYYKAMEVLVSEQDFYELTWAYLAKTRSQNVLYCEMFFDPQAHTGRGVAFDTVIRGIRRAQVQAAAELGVESQLIMCFLRELSAASAMETLLASLPYKAWIVGVGLDSDEKNNPPIKFAQVFARARAEGYRLTMHCDVNQQNTLVHIGQCLDVIGVDRIDHGINALEDPALCAEIARRGKMVEADGQVASRFQRAGCRFRLTEAFLARGQLGRRDRVLVLLHPLKTTTKKLSRLPGGGEVRSGFPVTSSCVKLVMCPIV